MPPESVFLDLGCGLPSAGHAAELITRIAPQARIVCVDVDPVAVAATRHAHTTGPRLTVVEADLRRPERLLTHRDLLASADFAEPVAALLVAVGQHLLDEELARLTAALRDATVTGSCLAVSHPAPAPRAPRAVRETLARFPAPWLDRPADTAPALIAGWTAEGAGVVPVTAWRPAGQPPATDRPAVPAWALLAHATTTTTHIAVEQAAG